MIKVALDREAQILCRLLDVFISVVCQHLRGQYVGIDATLKWIYEQTPSESILEASAHEELFWDLARLKNERSTQLSSLLVIFLYNSIPQIRYNRLAESHREGDAAVTPLAWDALVNDLGRFIADVSINTASMTAADVATLVRSLSEWQ